MGDEACWWHEMDLDGDRTWHDGLLDSRQNLGQKKICRSQSFLGIHYCYIKPNIENQIESSHWMFRDRHLCIVMQRNALLTTPNKETGQMQFLFWTCTLECNDYATCDQVHCDVRRFLRLTRHTSQQCKSTIEWTSCT